MGYTGIMRNSQTAKEQIKSEIERDLVSEDSLFKQEILKSSFKVNEAYIACRRTNKITSEIQDFIVVVIYSVRNNELTYKMMDESVHPYYYNCPISLIELTHKNRLQNVSALEWRIEVIRKAGEKKKVAKPLGKINGLDYYEVRKSESGKYTMYACRYPRKKYGWIIMLDSGIVMSKYRYESMERAWNELGVEFQESSNV